MLRARDHFAQRLEDGREVGLELLDRLAEVGNLRPLVCRVAGERSHTPTDAFRRKCDSLDPGGLGARARRSRRRPRRWHRAR
jgi:hypothetical protein